MIDLLARRRRRAALRRLDPADLHLEEELRHLDRQAAPHTPNARLRSQVHVQRVLEEGEVAARQRVLGREGRQRKGERRLVGLAEVELREGRRARRHVRHARDRGRAARARHHVHEGRHHVLGLGRQRVGAHDEARARRARRHRAAADRDHVRRGDEGELARAGRGAGRREAREGEDGEG